MSGISLGRWLGVPVRLHFSWFLIAALISISLGTQFTELGAGWSPAIAWAAALVAALLFFISILLHELAHATVARAYGMPVRSITLFALGGLAEIGQEASSAAREFWMALAGPATSFAIGGLALLAAAGFGWTPSGAPHNPAAVVLGWLGYINIGLACFNLIPGFPLDGGRVLRALVWAATGDAHRATTMASSVGRVVAVLFIAMGLGRMMLRGDAGGLWLAIIGWFLLAAVRAESEPLRRTSFVRKSA